MHDADIDLMIFVMRNGNERYLKYALKTHMFSSKIVNSEEVIEEYLKILKYLL